jgi:hypothetical protein
MAFGFLCGYGVREAVSQFRRARARALRLDPIQRPSDRRFFREADDQLRDAHDQLGNQMSDEGPPLQPTTQPQIQVHDQIQPPPADAEDAKATRGGSS